jgi:hypothetical protein
MAGGPIGSILYGAATNISNLVVPTGTAAVPGMVIIEATFGAAGLLGGAKEVYIDDVVLTRIS